jgi:nicotinamide phosphoribosyltransferase
MNNPLTKIDFYKADHRRQYPENTSLIYSNFTPRKSRIPGISEVLFFGMQHVILAFLIGEWQRGFFNRPKDVVVARYKRRMDNALGKDAVPVDHIGALHDLGYLPIEIKALPEGTLVPMRVPVFTIFNTHPDFFWLVNYLETALSNKMWKPMTSATIAFQFRKVFEKYYRETVDETGDGSASVMWQGHDFSYRGMSGDEDACTSSAGHLLSFYGTDTIPAIDFLEDYYFANSDEEIVGGSVPATEHSVMCMGISEGGEFETFRRLICDLYPSGIVSIVSDTMDYWAVLNDYLPRLKEEVLSRTGSPIGVDKVVIRPDSGDPYRIICGYFPEEIHEANDGNLYTPEGKKVELWEVEGSIERLWSTFGGSFTAQGYRQLCPKIGLIYGDSINLERQTMILEGLKRKGFASTNVVLGIGSFTYEYQTRDTFGFAMKATYGELQETYPDSGFGKGVGGQLLTSKTVGREIFKDPKTDDGTKKSAKGLLCVLEDRDHNIVLKDRCTWEEESEGLLQTVFRDGKILISTSLSEIRQRVNSYL